MIFRLKNNLPPLKSYDRFGPIYLPIKFAFPSVTNTVKALKGNRHPRGTKKGSVTGAGRLQECENTEFVWEFNKTGF